MYNFNETEYRTNLTRQIATFDEGVAIAKQITNDGYSNIFFVAVGGTVAMMMHFEEVAKQLTSIPVYVEQAGELVLTGHKHLNKDSLIIMGSKSGDTKETVAAAKWIKNTYGCRIASMVISKDSPLGQLTDYQLPLVVFKGVEYEYLSVFGLFYGLLNLHGDFPQIDDFKTQLQKLPDLLIAAQTKFDPVAEKIAEKYYNSPYLMWIGGGELWGEVYLFTMCILEEMQWIKTKSVKSSEFFHGTLELVDESTDVFLVKSAGATRPLDERVEKFLNQYGKKTVIIDIKEYMDGIDPAFAANLSPIFSTAVLNGRLSKYFEKNTGHDLDMRRYYRQFDY
ncbi:MAG: SIS domain-containing protein [Lachnospiraceae bacterium]